MPSAVCGDENEMEEYEVEPAHGRAFVPEVSEVWKPVGAASEEDLAYKPQRSGENGQEYLAEYANSEYDLANFSMSHDEFLKTEFHPDAKWEKTTDAVMGEKFVPMGVAHSELIPMLVKGMQELTERLEKLENSSNS